MISPTTDLADAVRAAGIRSTADFYALVLRLSPAEALLFNALFDASEPVPALELRRNSGGMLSNISLAARTLNAKLAAAGDTRRVVNRVEHGGGRGCVSRWALSEPEVGAA